MDPPFASCFHFRLYLLYSLCIIFSLFGLYCTTGDRTVYLSDVILSVSWLHVIYVNDSIMYICVLSIVHIGFRITNPDPDKNYSSYEVNMHCVRSFQYFGRSFHISTPTGVMLALIINFGKITRVPLAPLCTN